jgi:hypothetical protein
MDPMPADQHAALHYLQLLARGAPVEEYEAPVPTAPSPPSRGSRGEPDTARQLALRVRAELEGRRRREAELTALFETAHDLAVLRDLDAVLRAIVQRARSLLATEVAYMTLTDTERGDTYMRVTSGSVSARFQQLRLGMGEGLGGLVAQTARPYVTDDYLRDDRFRHTRTIDTGVTEEGLVAILGVPLLLGRAVIGVLYAADRRARVFEREEIALLGSFAAHAAVAIDTARLLAETRGALAELETATAVARDHARVIEPAGDIHHRGMHLQLTAGKCVRRGLAARQRIKNCCFPAVWQPDNSNFHMIRFSYCLGSVLFIETWFHVILAQPRYFPLYHAPPPNMRERTHK